MSTYHSTIWVCTDCLFAREGDGSPDRPADLPEEWSDIDFTRFSVTLGILEDKHADDCTPADREEGCDCTRRSFDTSWCDGCGSHLHGEREAYTLWDETV